MTSGETYSMLLSIAARRETAVMACAREGKPGTRILGIEGSIELRRTSPEFQVSSSKGSVVFETADVLRITPTAGREGRYWVVIKERDSRFINMD